MSERAELTTRLCRINQSIKPDDVVVAFGFDLCPDENSPVDGFVAVTSTHVYVYEDDRLAADFDQDKISEYIFTNGVGCVFAECVYDGEHMLLCRATMEHRDLISSVIWQLNRRRERGTYSYAYENEIDVTCPKCGIRYPSGSHVCPHCTAKTGYFKRIWEIARPYKFFIFLSIGLYFISAIVQLLPAYLNKLLIDNYIKVDGAYELSQTSEFIIGFIGVIVSLLGVNILTRAIGVVRGLTLIEAGTRMMVALRGMVFDKIQRLSVSKISKRTAGELMNRVTDDTNQLQNFITNDIGSALEQILIFLAVSVILFAYDWRLAFLILLPAPIVMIANRLFHTYMRRVFHRQWVMNSRANTILHDIFSGIRVVKAYGSEHREMERYDKATRDECNAQITAETFFAKFSPLMSFLMGIGEFFLLYYSGAKILSHEMTLGDMQLFTTYVSIIYGPLRWLSNFPRRYERTMTSVVKIFDIIDEDVDVDDKADAVELDIKGNIEFTDVSFGYDSGNNVLHNINLTVSPGDFVGIVGRSGVGKSTLINLVMRLYDVDDGSIKIDGVDIRDISQSSLRSQIGVVLQETFLFSGTVYENIAYAKPSATRDELLAAAKLAGAHSCIMKMPDAYNTRVGERGHTLSGGERQRIAIARALLHDPRILILDEATASLDTETEKQIQDALQTLSKNRTTLAIAHRLSTLRNATKLIVLDKGTVAEVGTHDELMRRRGIYYGLVMAQRQMSRMSS